MTLLSVSHNIVSHRHNLLMGSGKIKTMTATPPAPATETQQLVGGGGGLKQLRKPALARAPSVASSVARPTNKKMDKFISFNF